MKISRLPNISRFSLLIITAILMNFTGHGTISAQAIKADNANIKLFIPENAIQSEITKLIQQHGEASKFRIERGVRQTASFWRKEDGSIEDFTKFCSDHFVADPQKLDQMFQTIIKNSETIAGHFNKMDLDLKYPMQVEDGKSVSDLELMYGAYDASAHVSEDLYGNKIAFVITLNFPFYTLKEKNTLGMNWSRKEWAYARVGDMFISRVPAELNQNFSVINTKSDDYIANYNIMMGFLVDSKGNTYFPKDMKLISHWNLRDELKSHYGKPEGLKKQKMIYEVMKRIITQTIPEKVINSSKYTWNPESNQVYENGKEVDATPEPNIRYKYLLENFKALHAIDAYSPYFPTYIQRQFDRDMEMPVDEVENLFIELLSSPEVKDVGNLIKKRLGRNLEPFDIWYDGFKSRSKISQDELDKITKAKYPTKEAFAADLPNILQRLGFTAQKADFIADHVVVDPSRGAGHAWGAQMRSEKAHLRTRVGKDGMDYKGYNIAVHEFGHNVEQTFSLQNIDYYDLSGVPNNAFTEAVAFVFQSRDLDLLGLGGSDPDKKAMDALDNFWSAYEIMGVALVDIRTWKWLYAHPNATPAELNAEVNRIAKDVWNSYYSPVFGSKDEPILGIYSHMISYPLYLAAYPIGHLIEFAIENEIAGKNFGSEIERITSIGKLTPNAWLIKATGNPISVKPLLRAVDESLIKIKD